MLKIDKLTKKYGEKTAVDNVSLHIKPGEIYAFIGHNGAGKTTTIKCCCGIMKPDSGSVIINGVSLERDPIGCKKMLAYVPDNPDLYEFMTGIKYLNFISDVYGLSSSERAEKIGRFTDMFGITENLSQRIAEYSHGMKQKIALTAALIHSPKLLILDEPFVGLDPKASHSLKLVMRELCDEGGAIFFSTHVLDVAEKLCDRVAIIKNGVILESGAMDEIRGSKSLEDVFLELEDGNAD